MTRTIGKYQLQDTLGEGGFGTVYRAFDPLIERHVALKLLKAGLQLDPSNRQRFLKEARSAGRLQHPNIVAIYDMGEDEAGLYIAMEYVEGRDLRDFTSGGQPLGFEDKLSILSQVCRALDYAHSHDVIHRDIKPANIRITSRGIAKIMDFGLARLGASDLTLPGGWVGTPHYMSPEQARNSAALDHRTDLFSVGVVLYELLCGERPFRGSSAMQIIYRIVHEPHVPATSALPDLSPDLLAILDRALAKDREQRFATGQELAAELERFRARLPEEKLRLKQRLGERRFELADAEDYLCLLRACSPAAARPPERPPAGPSRSESSTAASPAPAAARVEELLLLGERLLGAGDFEGCLGICAEAGAEAPGLPRLLDLQGRATAGLAQQQAERVRREEVSRLVVQAERALQTEQLEQAAQLLRRCASLDAGHGPANHLRERLAAKLAQEQERKERARRSAERLESATRLLRDGDLDGALALAQEVLAEAPSQARALALRGEIERARRARRIEQERAARLAELLASAEAQARTGNSRAFGERIAEALAFEPGYPPALAARAAYLERGAAGARRDLDAGRTEAALAAARELLAVDPAHGGLLALEREAAAALRERERARSARAAREEQLRAEQEERRRASEAASLRAAREAQRASARTRSGPGLDRRLGLALAAAGVLLGALGIALWKPARREEPVASPPPGQVLIDAQPWARVTGLVAQDAGLSAPKPECVTPCLLSLAPGRYRAELEHPDFPGATSIDFAVTAGGVTRVAGRIEQFRFEADPELRRILSETTLAGPAAEQAP